MCNEKLAEDLAKKLQNLQVYTPIHQHHTYTRLECPNLLN